ncbi:MAG: EMC3/TMCO1 family protein [Candidatus Bathyarchaeota archaeon]
MSWFDFLFEAPYSLFFIFFVNICVVLAGSLVFRRMININRLEAQESKVQSHNRSLNEAKRRNDEGSLRKLKREQVRIKRISASASKQRMNAGLVTIIPFAAVSLILSVLYSGKDIVFFPFEFVLFSKTYSFSIWYFLTYLTAYLPLSRVFRTTPNFWQKSSEVKSG